MKSRLIDELNEDKGKLAKFRVRMSVIARTERLKGHVVHTKPKQPPLKRPTITELREKYELVVSDLSRSHPECTQRTPFEKKALCMIREHTDLKFYTSLWIGNRNVDLFCPAIGSLYPPNRKGQKRPKEFRERGLVIEIDGAIHNDQLKIKKDESRNQFLKDLDIGVTVIENLDTYTNQVTNLLSRLKDTPRLDHRARERLWRKIYVTTIIYHGDDQTLIDLYGVGMNKIFESPKYRGAK